MLKNFEKTIIFLAKALKDYQYAIRGTASLVLQGFEMNVDDIDILCDKKTALACNEIFKDYLLEKVEFKISDKFKSYFGKFKINGVDVEVMGEWQIKIQNPKSKIQNWSEVFSATERKKVRLDGQEIWVTTPESELKMFAAMGRWNAYHKIKKQLLDKAQSKLLQ